MQTFWTVILVGIALMICAFFAQLIVFLVELVVLLLPWFLVAAVIVFVVRLVAGKGGS